MMIDWQGGIYLGEHANLILNGKKEAAIIQALKKKELKQIHIFIFFMKQGASKLISHPKKGCLWWTGLVKALY